MSCWRPSEDWEAMMMTMNKIMTRLRKNGKGQYRLLGLCVFLSVLLVSSFAFMYFSHTVQEFLPEGGDTRKLCTLMMGVTVIGCTIFTVYGTSLFFRYKSREMGVFLALGEQKGNLAKALVKDMAKVILKYVALGIAGAVPMSFLIWKGFQLLVINTAEMAYRPSVLGLLVSLVFVLFLMVCVLVAGVRFMKRTDVMEILNQQRKTEMVKEIRPWTGKLGMALCAAGLLLAMAVPALSVRLFDFGMPTVWNGTYLLCVAGLYFFMLSAVGRAKKGKHPEKYYKNIVSVSLMRFTARQTTRNMCVSTLLIFVMLLSAFWGVMYYNSAFAGTDKMPADCAFHFPAAEEKQIGEEDIYKMAEDYQVDITSYEEMEAAQLMVRYQEKDFSEKTNKYFDREREKLASFVSASDFARIAGTTEEALSIGQGQYKTVVSDGYEPSVWITPDCLEEITNPVAGQAMTMTYGGTEVYDNMTTMSDPFLFVISDEDYAAMTSGLGASEKERMIFFDVKDVMDTYDFAEALQREYISRATSLSDHMTYYDAYEEQQALAKGEEYGYAGSIDISPENTQLTGDWKYAPYFSVLMKVNAMQMVSIYVLLCIYIAIISLVAIGIMNYVRSVTIAEDNRILFGDLERLGADREYKRRVIKGQLQKIFAYPAVAGCGVTLIFTVLLCYFNDMRFIGFEIAMIGMELGLMVLLGAFLYGVYRLSFKRMAEIVRL
ncbi:MAG: ABC transporter permease [Bacillota bacterium]|nr:ABC transporter permease [Bacillota bacterium]